MIIDWMLGRSFNLRPAVGVICSNYIWQVIALLWPLMLVNANADELARKGTFEGQWTVVGEKQRMQFIQTREVYITRHRGSVKFDLSGGLPRAMFSECLEFGDSKTGAITRCRWVDTANDHIYSELAAEIQGAEGPIRGRIVGGTGRYQGIQGEFEFADWVYMAKIEREGTIHGYTDTLRGHWKLP